MNVKCEINSGCMWVAQMSMPTAIGNVRYCMSEKGWGLGHCTAAL